MRIEQSFGVARPPVDGRWTLADHGAGGTRVHFVAEGPLSGPAKLAEPLLRRGIARSFRHYHALLARNVEAQSVTARPSDAAR